MGYADGLLSTGERVIHRDKQHWFVLVWDARFSILAIVLGVVLAVVKEQATPPASDALNVLAIVLIVGGLLVVAWSILDFWNHEYVLTNRRVLEVEGVLNKRSADSSLEKINDAILVQTLLGRIFGFGDLEVLTASEAGISEFRMLIDPIKFKRKMLDAKHEYEMDTAGGYVGGPPLRTSPAPGGGPASRPAATPPADDAEDGAVDASELDPGSRRDPAAIPPAAGGATAGGAMASGAIADPRRMTSDELTRTLASLADLRDRGALSPEEYEAKKADLLARL
jgi:Bacterial PH domain/Short C-terminal domain